ncbi:MAG: exodeoxyribonuclease VII large subunit, partial [Spirochaetia bacterium]|nr:exodeoxyribonuclease VII large subunit [Spirochaetia bacterium]
MKILARVSVTSYGARSQYQLNVQEITLAGAGELRLRVERLKKALHAEGLFDPSKKKPLPVLPVTIGVATAPDGAAVQDIIHVARTRFPHINILLAPCVVQGPDAPSSIIAAIQLLNDPAHGVDVIIAGRGGGSFEDLMAFNEESVVRAFAASRLPIISAVGHEVDSVLSDFAADAFAATPSAAAQRAVPVLSEIEEKIDRCAFRLKSSLQTRYRSDRDRLRALLRARVFLSPRSILLDERAQFVDDAAKAFRQAARVVLKDKSAQLRSSDALSAHYKNLLSGFQKQFEIASERLANFSPLATLKRGYAIVRNAAGEVIRDSLLVQPGERLEVLLEKGRLQVQVEKKD